MARISELFMKFLMPRETLWRASELAKGKKDPHRLYARFGKTAGVMKSLGRERDLELLCWLAVVIAVGGSLVCLLVRNIFLLPAVIAAAFFVPWVLGRSAIRAYEKRFEAELETSLSVVTTALIRTGDILSAVRESLPYIKKPVKESFQAFLTDATLLDAGTGRALFRLSRCSENTFFREWCAQLALCLEDHSLIGSLPPVVQAMSEERMIRGELENEVRAKRGEYLTLVGMTALSLPLMKLINPAWFGILCGTVPGQLAVGICAAVILFTAVRMFELTEKFL